MRRFVRFLMRLDDLAEVLVRWTAGAVLRRWRLLIALGAVCALMPPAVARLMPVKPVPRTRILVHRNVQLLHGERYQTQLRGTAISIVAGDHTTVENFHRRWYLADNFTKEQAQLAQRPPVSAAELVSVRIDFYRDPGSACRRLDALLVRAVL